MPPAPLPDGWWFGYVHSFDRNAASVGVLTFDLGCFYAGITAVQEANHNGVSLGTGRVFVRNQNTATYQAQVTSSTEFLWVDSLGEHRVAESGWPAASSVRTCPGVDCAVWIRVVGGRVAVLVEQERGERCFCWWSG